MRGNVERTNWIVVFGWFGIAVAAMYWVWNTQAAGLASPDYLRNTRDIAIVSGALIVGGWLMRKLSTSLGIGQGRCKKCGKIIPAGEVYCYNHSLRQIWDAQDQMRDK